METKDREAIEGLFGKLSDVERQAGPRDAEAEAFIAGKVARNPGAPYYMAQTIVMQEIALGNQNREIEDLRRQVEGARRDTDEHEGASEGGFLSRILGGGSSNRSRTSVPSTGAGLGGDRGGNPWGGGGGARRPQTPQQYGGGYGAPQAPGFGGGMGGMGGGGFLAGAAQTAMGVAGGVMLGNALGGLFGGHDAPAAPAADASDAGADQAAATPAEDAAADGGAENASFDDTAAADDGGWGGDDGGFSDI